MTDLSMFFKKLSAPLDRPYKRIAASLFLISFPPSIACLILIFLEWATHPWRGVDTLVTFLTLDVRSFYSEWRHFFFAGGCMTYLSAAAVLFSYGAKYWLDPLVDWVNVGGPKRRVSLLIAWIKNGNPKD